LLQPRPARHLVERAAAPRAIHHARRRVNGHVHARRCFSFHSHSVFVFFFFDFFSFFVIGDKQVETHNALMVLHGAASHAACWHHHATAKGREDLHLLPLLLRAANSEKGSRSALLTAPPGRFLEIGALNGLEASQTLIMERCYGWRGVLVEGNPTNYRDLTRSRRTADYVFSVAGRCSSANTANISVAGRGTAGLLTVPKDYPMSGHRMAGTTEVPCRSSLLDLWRERVPQGERLNFLSLDVEGSEEQVVDGMLDGLRTWPIDIMLVEASSQNGVAKRQSSRVRAKLESVRYERLLVPTGMGIKGYSENDVWVAPWLARAGAQRLLNLTAHSTSRAPPFVEFRHCDHRAVPGWCNVSMRAATWPALERAFAALGENVTSAC
jgi:FkbM family methyltransferase